MVTFPPTLHEAYPLRRNLILLAPLHQPNGTRYDYSGNGLDLSENNSVPSANGVSMATRFNTPNNHNLQIASQDRLSPGDSDFFWCGWVYFESLATSGNFNSVIAKWNETSGDREYMIEYDGTSTYLQFQVRHTSAGTHSVEASTFGALSASTWYFFYCYHDATANEIGISINDGTIDTTTSTNPVESEKPAEELWFGARGNGTQDFDGYLQHVAFGNGSKLTTSEITEMYNLGNGIRYNDISSAIKDKLTAYWPLSEAETDARHDAHNADSVASYFTNANTEYLSVASNSDFQTGDVNLYVACWVRLDNKSTDQVFMSKWNNDGANARREWTLDYYSTNDRFRFQVSSNGLSGGITSREASTFGAPVVGRWYFLQAYHDPTANTIAISVDNGTFDTVSHSGGICVAGLQDASVKIGAQGATGSSTELELDGQVQFAGIWKGGIPSSGDRTTLFNSNDGLYYSELTSGLKTNLIAYYDLKEPRSDLMRADNHTNGYHLTNNNTVTHSAGIKNNSVISGQVGGNADVANSVQGNVWGRVWAAQFTNANSEYLSITDPAGLEPGDADVSWTCWVYFDSLSADRGIFGKWQTSANNREYNLHYNNSSNQFDFEVSGNGGTSQATTVGATTFGAPSTGTWYFIYCEHDSVNNTIGISINDGTLDTASHTQGIAQKSGDFQIGAYNTADYMDGRISRVRMWGKVLTAAEITAEFNKGVGLAYAELSSTTNLTAAWDLDEESGTRSSDHGSFNLTDNATVTKNPGVGSRFSCGFTNANSEYLSRADTVKLRGGDRNLTLAIWLYLLTISADRMMIAKDNASATTNDFLLRYRNAASRLAFSRSNGSSTVHEDLDTLAAVETDNWKNIMAMYNTAIDRMLIAYDDQASFDSNTTNTSPSTNSAQSFDVGARTGGTTSYMDGRLAMVLKYDRELTYAERSFIYNRGQYRTEDEILNATHAELASFWNEPF